MLSAETELELSDASRIRFLTENEVDELHDQILKRKSFARTSYENRFYLERIREMAKKTVIEVYRPGDPEVMYKEAEDDADLIEKISILSTTLVTKKDVLHSRLGISPRPGERVTFVIGPEFRYLRSNTNPAPQLPGIKLDEKMCRRFKKCGFPALYAACLRSQGLNQRVKSSLDWLFESRLEPHLSASVVKTAIALESLLIFSESEPLARSLCERMAFILTSVPQERERLSKIVKEFYNVRSGVVHGNEKKMRKLTPELVESMDRLILLVYLVMAANPSVWTSVKDLQSWCERQRWGNPATDITIPYSRTYLNKAMQLAEK